MRYKTMLLILTAACLVPVPRAAAQSPDQYNVVWRTPSEDAAGSMPLGNGDITLNAWVEPTGDIVFYIGKTDLWSDNGRLLKLGRVRVTLDPPFPVDKSFEQTLQLSNGTMVVKSGEPAVRTEIQLWVDANHPVVQVSVKSARPVTATASIELWRTQREELKSLEVSDVLLDRAKPDKRRQPVFVEPDTLMADLTGAIGWFHHNQKSFGPTITAKIQGVTAFPRPDPLLHRTFGAVIAADQAHRVDALTLRCEPATSHRFDIFVLTQHPALPDQWAAAMKQLRATIGQTSREARLANHRKWWKRFWQRSWIEASNNASEKAASLVPKNRYAMRIGVDQHGANRFRGEFGRLRILDGVLDPVRLRVLADPAKRTIAEDLPDQLYSRVPEIGATIPESVDWGSAGGLTLEGWIKPEKMSTAGGRIIDKVTPGGSDGLLFDTYPGTSLRLIVGQQQLSARDVLTPGQWTHVAATIDSHSGNIVIFVNGSPVAEQSGLGGDDAQVVSQMYALQRFIDACAGRGAYPIKFNGSLFTVPYPDRPGDADYRRWGPGYWWQNTRLPYISMCTSGDFEMMRPLFRMYADQLMPLQKYRTKLYLDHEGAFIPECIYFWGDVFSETYGWTPFEQRKDKLQESGYHKWEWVSGPELVWMMLDYYEHTQDAEFLESLVLPTAHEILTFFDQQYRVGPDGKLVMHPAQALETWWDATNPMPEVAGLHAVTSRLLALPSRRTSEEERAFWTALQEKLPDLPQHDIDGHAALAPATKFTMKRNIENPELYAVFPFRLVSFEKNNAALGRVALEHRGNRGSSGWRQDDIFMAYLGLADQAQEYLVSRARKHDSRSRFPAFWGPNYDWVPDQDHGGILMKALQSMLIQTEGKKIFLAPAWPKQWNVQFRLHAPYRTVLQGRIRDGRIESLEVTPRERMQDIVFGVPKD